MLGFMKIACLSVALSILLVGALFSVAPILASEAENQVPPSITQWVTVALLLWVALMLPLIGSYVVRCKPHKYINRIHPLQSIVFLFPVWAITFFGIGCVF